MERLNDIMGRNAQRRQHPSEPRTTQGSAGQTQRSSHAPQSPLSGQGTRRTLPEQTARMGQQAPSYTSQHMQHSQHYEQPSNATRSRASQDHNADDTLARDPRNYGATSERTVYQRQRPATNGSSAYQPRPRSVEEVQPQTPRPLPTRSERPERDYRRSDAYPPMQADVVDEWEVGEEVEEPSNGMRYGDWEEDGSEYPPSYQYGEMEIAPPSRAVRPASPASPTRPLTPHDLTVHRGEGLAAPYTGSDGRDMRDLRHVTRNLRETREVRDVRAPLAPAAQPPAPQTRTQEMHRSQRNTQPLNPYTIKGMSRERGDMPHDPPPNQRSSRSHPPREQEQPYSQPVMPSPAPARGVCPKCRGAGYLRIDVPFGHPNFGKPVACECKEAEKKEKRRQQLLEISDLSAFHNKTFRNFNVRFPGVHPSVLEAYQEAVEYAQNPDGWLFMIGPNGCGKTHLAAAIANQSLSSGAVVLFSVVPDLLAHLRATFAPNALEAYDQRFSKMREAELLVLDDLGAHQSSPWASEKLFQLLNYRYNSGYPTVITANKQGLSSVDERILSRLSDTALVTTVVLNGAVDYRRQNPRKDSPYR